jgi:outer membrane lipoprotein-sorting protein
MKLNKLFFAIIMACIVISSCESNEEGIDFASLVGNWALTDIHGTTESVVTASNQTVTSTSTQEGVNYNAFVEFTENPNEFIGTGSATISLTTTVTGIGTSSSQYDTLPLDNGTWEIIGNQIIIDGNSEMPATILELSDTTFRIQFNASTDETANGVTTQNAIEFYQTYTRQ